MGMDRDTASNRHTVRQNRTGTRIHTEDKRRDLKEEKERGECEGGRHRRKLGVEGNEIERETGRNKDREET